MDLSLHKLPIAPRKSLTQGALSGLAHVGPKLSSDVNKQLESAEPFCVSQIHRELRLKHLRI